MRCGWERTIGLALALAAAVLAAPPVARAQGYPSKAIHIVVPYAPGGGVDRVARIVGDRLADRLGQPVIVENKPGAATNIGMDQVAKSAPDGYTLLMASPTFTVNGALFATLPFDLARDFVPVAKVGYAPLVVVVPAGAQWASLGDLLAAAKAQPGKLTYGTAGNGSSGHLAGEALKVVAGVDVVHVPYKGGSPAITDLLGDRLSFMPINPIEVISHVKAGRLRALAVASPKRIAMLPDVPTATEAGLAGFEATVWWGLVAPARTPTDVIEKLNAATVAVLAEPGTREKLAEQGVIIDTGSAASFGEFLKSETARWAKLVRAANIKPD
jgi:tripartite-type tricarboxylate transporter receptor subunit TctC